MRHRPARGQPTARAPARSTTKEVPVGGRPGGLWPHRRADAAAHAELAGAHRRPWPRRRAREERRPRWPHQRGASSEALRRRRRFDVAEGRAHPLSWPSPGVAWSPRLRARRAPVVHHAGHSERRPSTGWAGAWCSSRPPRRLARAEALPADAADELVAVAAFLDRYAGRIQVLSMTHFFRASAGRPSSRRSARCRRRWRSTHTALGAADTGRALARSGGPARPTGLRRAHPAVVGRSPTPVRSAAMLCAFVLGPRRASTWSPG